jgi:predicted CopG family antitoxin
MKKIILCLMIFSVSAMSFSQDQAVVKKKKKKKVAPVTEVAKPCDSKEDILKKLEEKKKEEVAPKAFSLQGGDTGCKVK